MKKGMFKAFTLLGVFFLTSCSVDNEALTIEQYDRIVLVVHESYTDNYGSLLRFACRVIHNYS